MAANSLLGSFESLWHYGRLPLCTSTSPLHISSSLAPSLTHLTRSASSPVATESASSSSEVVQLGSLQSLFSVMDEDSNGRLSLCEMRSLLTKLLISSQSTDLESFIEHLSSTLQIDDGFSLDLPQFAQLYASLFDASHASSTQAAHPVRYENDDDDELADAFRVFDTNQDGFICAAELAAVLLTLRLLPADHCCGVNAHLSRCQAYIESVDLNGDGRVDLDEFKAMMAHHHL